MDHVILNSLDFVNYVCQHNSISTFWILQHFLTNLCFLENSGQTYNTKMLLKFDKNGDNPSTIFEGSDLYPDGGLLRPSGAPKSSKFSVLRRLRNFLGFTFPPLRLWVFPLGHSRETTWGPFAHDTPVVRTFFLCIAKLIPRLSRNRSYTLNNRGSTENVKDMAE